MATTGVASPKTEAAVGGSMNHLTIIQGEHSLIMHNFPPDTKGRWVSRDNGDGTSSYTYELYPNRAQRRLLKRRGKNGRNTR